MSDVTQARRSVRLYTVYLILANALFWRPVFMLFFSSIVPLKTVFVLEGIYYISVFLFEVPSGYFSDHVGRRRTLLISTSFLTAAYIVFFLASSFGALVIGQVFLAIGFAFASGTDTALHYAVMVAAGRGDEYGEREARLGSWMLIASAISSLIGGVVAFRHAYRGAYLLAAVCSALAGVAIAALHDPESPKGETRNLEAVTRSITIVRDCLKEPTLRYLFFFAVVLVVLRHVPYQFTQLFLRRVVDRIGISSSMGSSIALLPLVTGVHSALTVLVSAIGTRLSLRTARAVGTKPFLIGVTVAYAIVIITLVGPPSLPLALFLLIQGVPGGMATPVVRSIVVPRVESQVRATYLSIESLVGRAAFGGTLLLFHLLPGDGYYLSLVSAAMIAVVAAVAFSKMRLQ